MRLASIRVTRTVLASGSIALLAACGSSPSAPPHSPASTASTGGSTATAAPSDDSTPSSGTGGISAGDVVFSSTLQPPTHDLGTSATVTQDSMGLTLTVTKPAGGYTYSAPIDLHGIPQNLAVRVHVAMASPASGIYYGIACRGLGQNQQYLLLSDADGKWVIVQVNDGKQKVLKQGTADGVDATSGVTVDAACVTPQSDDKMNRLVLALNGKVVGSVDDSYENVAISNSFELFAISPDQTTGTGSVVFNRLEVRSASAA